MSPPESSSFLAYTDAKVDEVEVVAWPVKRFGSAFLRHGVPHAASWCEDLPGGQLTRLRDPPQPLAEAFDGLLHLLELTLGFEVAVLRKERRMSTCA